MNLRWWHILFWLCALAEPFLLTKWASGLGVHWGPVVWLTTALVPTGLILWKYGSRYPNPSQEPISHTDMLRIWGVYSFCMLVCAICLSGIIASHEVNPTHSDILPSLKLYVTRLLAGTDPYAPMEFPGWTVMPNYFPLRWLPFVPAEVFKFDYRWIGFIAISIVFWYYTKQVIQSGGGRLRQILLPVIAPWLMLFVFLQYDKYAFGQTVETLIAAYYLALAFTVFRSPAAMAFGITICLLSRISFTFWLPMYGLLILFQEGWGTALRTGLYVVLAVFVIYIVPFILPDGGKMFLDGLKYYAMCAKGEWYPQSWQPEGAIPTHLGRGIGFAYYWYQKGAEEISYAACQRDFQLICAGTAVLLFAGYWFGRKHNLRMRLYAVASLKIYLCVFYAFFPIPYHYLYLTPCLLSLAVWAVVMERGKD